MNTKIASSPVIFNICRLATHRLLIAAVLSAVGMVVCASGVVVDDFNRPNSNYHGDGWETLTPGFWRNQDNSLVRDVRNLPSGPYGMIWNRNWKLSGNFKIEADFDLLGDCVDPEKDLLGLCFGGDSQFETWHGGGAPGDASYYAAWRGSGEFGVFDHSSDVPKAVGPTMMLSRPVSGSRVVMSVEVSDGESAELANLTATLVGAVSGKVIIKGLRRSRFTDGYIGLVCRGGLAFSVNEVRLQAGTNSPQTAPLSNLCIAMPLGMSLKQDDGRWTAKILAFFRNEGGSAEIRISPSENPPGGWQNVPVAGSATIVTSEFREHTSAVTVTLPGDPAGHDYYYTVWKDGRDSTADPRVGAYVGRLPRLSAPYRLVGFGGHSITAKEYTETNKTFPWNIEREGWHNINNMQKMGPNRELFQSDWIFEQYADYAFQHFDEFNTQILIWEDDIWYLEMPLFPPTTRDVYKRVLLTIGGRRERKMIMRNWNILSPGDHDFGMDDFRGTEQWAVRNLDQLPQDGAYLRKNFAAIWHICTGDETEYTRSNPVRYGRWRMPNGDFSIVLVDSRLWRTTSYANIWDTAVYERGEAKNMEYAWTDLHGWDRTDPSRALLGEKQFSWLEQVVRTDPSPALLMVGVNGLHSITHDRKQVEEYGKSFQDLAAFNKAAVDRLIELFSSRPGVVSVYGDLHFSAALYNPKKRLLEAVIGSVCRTGSRRLKEGWGPVMRDWDGRSVEIRALYHRDYNDPSGVPLKTYVHFGFVEFEFDTRPGSRWTDIRIRHLKDAPGDPVRGGGAVRIPFSEMGRIPTAYLPDLKILPDADVWISDSDGMPIRATRSSADGTVLALGLTDVKPGERLRVIAQSGDRLAVKSLTAQTNPGTPSAEVMLRAAPSTVAAADEVSQ